MNTQIEQMSEEEREEIVQYGLKRGKVIFLSTFITIMLGWLFGVVWQSIVFWFSFSILRKYIGGYHADTERQCYISSFVMVVISLLCIKTFDYSEGWTIALLTVSLIAILFLAPVGNTNHILDEDEKRKYGLKGKITASLLYLIYVFLYFTKKQISISAIATAILLGTILLVLGYVKIYKDTHIMSKG